MAGKNRVQKIGKETIRFSIQIEKEVVEKLRKVGLSRGHSLGYMLRSAAKDIVQNKDCEKLTEVFTEEIKKSPLITGEKLPDGQKYSEYVADRIVQSVDKRINK